MTTTGQPMKTFAAALVLALAGCAAPSVHVAQSSAVKPATAEQVRPCAYLDDLVGTSGWYGVAASKGIENARSEMLLRAEKIGATHVVWGEPTVRYGGTSITGKAYRCPT